MFLNKPTLIPKIRGKITFQKKGNSIYVLYDIGRQYDPNRKYCLKNRTMIGVQIPGRPEMMLPNENYLTYFPKGEENMTEEEKKNAQDYADERENGLMLRDFFEQLFFEFQMMSRKKPNGVVNEYKVERLNRVLRPLLEMMKGEKYATFLEEIPMPQVKTTKDGEEIKTGLTYSDAALMMTQFKSAVNRYFQRI